MATLSGAVGPVLVPLARSPLKLIKRQGVRLICPHCQGRMTEGKACCKACDKGKKCDGKGKKISEGVRPVPDCRPVTPPDPDCTLAGGWAKAMQRKGLGLLKKPKKRSARK